MLREAPPPRSSSMGEIVPSDCMTLPWTTTPGPPLWILALGWPNGPYKQANLQTLPDDPFRISGHTDW